MPAVRPAAEAVSSRSERPGRLIPEGRESWRHLADHLATHGPLPLPHRHGGSWSDELIAAVASSGLAGRGGGGFPAARKWEALRARRIHPDLIVNAMEGEPASQKDQVLLAVAPHLVLDGAELVAAILSARAVTVCVPDDRPDTASHVAAALAERVGAGLGRPDVKIVRPPRRYITGEESALVKWIGGGFARPQFRATKAHPLSVGRRPVLIQNAETLAHVALVARHGPDWFRQAGTPDAPGTCLVTVSGAVDRPGVYEIELGTPVRDVLGRAGRHQTSGVLLGGYGGAWLAPDRIETPYAPGPLARVGAGVGAGVIAALPSGACGVSETARVAAYMANESAGQCGPCLFGLHAVAQDLVDLARADGDRNTFTRLRTRLGVIDGRGACAHPDGVVRMVRSALEVFAADFAEHARHRPCAAWNGQPVLPVPHSAADAVRRRRWAGMG